MACTAILPIFYKTLLLNNQRQSTTTPTSLRIETDEGHWALYLPEEYLVQNALMALDLEKESDYWEDVPGWSLRISAETK